MAGARRRVGVALLVVLVAFAGIALGVRSLWHAAQTVVKADGCDFGSYSLDTEQAAIASAVTGVVLRRRLPARAAVLTIGAALQESKLRNLPVGEGDRDSVGILQQRPSQGWGTAEQISDVRYATGKFLDAVVKVADWQHDSLAAVVQTVQISADGAAYARHEAEATAITDALMGTAPAGVSCHFGKPGKVATANQLIEAVQLDLPVSASQASAKTVTVPGAGWATAAWFVCNADRLGIDSVAYSGKRWSRTKGWKAHAAAPTTEVSATLA